MPENNAFFRQIMDRYTVYDPMPEVDRDFIEALLHTIEEKTFCPSDFDRFPVGMIVEYIKRTHVFYLEKKLPEIEQSIILLSGLYNITHPILSILHNFFQSYCQDLTSHIRAEETRLLPYIDTLQRGVDGPAVCSEYILARQQYSVAAFLADHHDTEDELKDIRQTIRLYDPPATNESLYRILLSQLETFEQDLCVHAHIEDEVLIPKALQMETLLNDRLDGIAKSN